MSVPTYAKPHLLAEITERQHAVIEASAGTGKTFTIEHLVAELVLSGVDIAKILVVTFTERAAAELRTRIRSLLWRLAEHTATEAAEPDEDLWLLDSTAKEKLRIALASIDAATISTIHAFCQKLLTENAFSHRRLFSQRHIDGSLLFAEVYRDFVREQLAPGSTLGALLRPELENLAGNADPMLPSLESGLYAAVRSASPLRPALDEALVRRTCTRAMKELEPTAGTSLQPTSIDVVFEAMRDALPLSGLAFWARLAGLHAPSPTNPGKFALRQLVEDLRYRRELTAHAHTALSILANEVPTARGLMLIECADELRRRMAEAKRAKGLFDFDDMLHVLDESLEREGTQAIAATRDRYTHALIDEFQDTDPIQWDVFRRLFFEGAPTHLYLIGDPKQAIYGFRSADVNTYIRARDEIMGGGKPFHLKTNFRSGERMIAAYNSVITGADHFFGEGSGITYGAEEAVECGDPAVRVVDPEGNEVVPLHLLVGTTHSTARDTVVPPTARQIVREIRRLVHRFKVCDRKNPEGRPLLYKDIFILAGSWADTAIVMGALREARVPFTPFRLDGLFQTPEVRDLLLVLRAVADPFDRAARMPALLTPFFELRPGEAEPLRDAAEDHPTLRPLFQWHAWGRRREFRKLFAGLLDDSGYSRRAALMHELRPALANVQRVLALLEDEVRRRQPSLNELLDALTRWSRGEATPGEGTDLQTATVEGSAVQVMTMHASKGLEAPVVFLVGGLGARTDGDLLQYRDDDGQRCSWAGGMPPAGVAKKIAVNLDEERRRLAYVVLTRAKGLLYAPVYRQPEGGEARLHAGVYTPLHARLCAMALSKPDPELVTVEPLDLQDDGSLSTAAESAEPWKPEIAEVPPGFDAHRSALTWQRRGRLVTSYSGITRQTRPTDEHEKEESTGETNRAETDPNELPTTNIVGSFLHDALEELDLRLVARLSQLSAFERDAGIRSVVEPLADEAGVAIEHRRHAYRLLHAALHHRLPGAEGTVPPIATLSRVLRETEFLLPIPERAQPLLASESEAGRFYAGRGYLKGFIDVVFEHEGKVYVGDWKSSVVRSSAPAELDAYVREHFDWQVVVYGLAMTRILGIHSAADLERRFGGVLYLFLREMEKTEGDAVARGVWFHRPSWDEVLSWQQRLLEHGYGRSEVA